jgi:hypothetical protein
LGTILRLQLLLPNLHEERMMERTDEKLEETIDLGTASNQTKGAPGLYMEFGVIAMPWGISAE